MAQETLQLIITADNKEALKAIEDLAKSTAGLKTKFVEAKEATLNESSTDDQKKDHLQNKAQIIISETLRQSNIKWKIYNVIDEMYKEVKASDLSEVLSAEDLYGSIKESFVKSLREFLVEINYELKENSK